MMTGFQNCTNAVVTSCLGVTQAQILAAQTTVFPSTSVQNGAPVLAGGQPVVSLTNYPTGMKHSPNGEDSWADPALFVEILSEYNQSTYNYRI